MYKDKEMYHLYEQKSASRDELVHETRKAMLEMSRQMVQGICEHPDMERLMGELAQQLGSVKGKKSYGYLSKPLKKLVDEIVNQTEHLPVVHRCYQTWWELQCQVHQFYSGQEQQRPPLSQQKEFRAIKNAVIKEAERIRLNRISFEDRGMEDRGGWLEDQELPWDCYELRSIMENEDLSREERVDAAVQMKRLAQAGDAHAQYLMGLLYRGGGLVIPDTERAQYWMEQAATQNVPAAQYSLGKLLLSDDPLVHDPDQGIRWLKASGQNGNDYAAYTLGKEYLSGRYVFKNTEKAAEYFRQAAQEDSPWAQYLLGKLYLMGDGVEQDEHTAYRCFQAAAEQGHVYAEFFVERMELGLTASPQLMLSTTRLLHHMGNISEPKTKAANRTIILPTAMVELLAEYKKGVFSELMFPSRTKPDQPIDPGYVRKRLQAILKRAGCKKVRFHDLRHTFATLSLENGMDVKTLSTIIGHVSSETTLNTYTHITDEMRRKAALNIDQGIAKAEVQPLPEEEHEEPKREVFTPVQPTRRRPGTGSVSQINDHLWEGRYSPVWPDGKKRPRNVYAPTQEKCEEKLAELIRGTNAEIAALRSGESTDYPDDVNPKKKAIADYLREHPGVTNKSQIARELHMSRPTVQRYYDEVQAEFRKQF